MSNTTNNQVFPVGMIRREDGPAKPFTRVEHSRLNELPDGTVLFAMREEEADAGLMQEVVALEQLERLKSAQPLTERLAIVRLAVAVIGNSRRKLDLFGGVVEMMKAAIAKGEIVRAELTEAIAETRAELVQLRQAYGGAAEDESPAAWVEPEAWARHKRTGTVYKIVGVAKVKIGGTWRNAVSYDEAVEGGDVFVREAGPFNRSFEPA